MVRHVFDHQEAVRHMLDSQTELLPGVAPDARVLAVSASLLHWDPMAMYPNEFDLLTANHGVKKMGAHDELIRKAQKVAGTKRGHTSCYTILTDDSSDPVTYVDRTHLPLHLKENTAFLRTIVPAVKTDTNLIIDTVSPPEGAESFSLDGFSLTVYAQIVAEELAERKMSPVFGPRIYGQLVRRLMSGEKHVRAGSIIDECQHRSAVGKPLRQSWLRR
jgi:hypothetical protein